MKTYPAIMLVARHGRWLAFAAAAVLALFSVALYLSSGSLLKLAAGLIVAAGAFVVVRVGAELVEVISDTLLPR